ncbi:MAG: efflux RND transporter permease subunit, partial [Alphaproteobacteria bacterium]|nr:efflux RND transporter permease subunit [Alphaproteobacteria bacterium]
LIIFRSPGANIIRTIDRVKAELPVLKASIPAAIDISVPMDRSASIRTSLRDVEMTLLLAVLLVTGVVYLFLQNGRATLIPSIAVPVSLIGTFGAMYLLGYSLDNLSLMALIVGTGFVVDDAIVVLENVTRHLEDGMPRREAVLQGAREVSFTVLSMSLSLVAVFIPILMMGGIVGRLFREFAAVLSVAILISLCVSLTATPMMCARILRGGRKENLSRLNRAAAGIKKMHDFYARTLKIALKHRRLTLTALFAVIALNFYLFIIIPKGFFPQQDIGRIMGAIRGDQSISFQLMRKKMEQFVAVIRKDPDVTSVVAFTGGDSTNTGRMFIALKSRSQRPPVDRVIERLRKKLAKISGATLFLQAVQDIRVGGRMGNAEYQYTLQSDSLSELQRWAPVVAKALEKLPELREANSDEQTGGLMSNLVIDRDAAARLGLTMSQIDNTLYDAFGQRQVSTIYNALNQYHVVMEVAPQYWQSPDTLKDIYVSRTGGALSGAEATNGITGAPADAAVQNAGVNA